MEPLTPIKLTSDTELHPFRPEDAEELHAVIIRNLHRLHEWLPWARLDYSLDDTKQFLAMNKAMVMSVRHSGRLVGAIELHSNAHIGYWLDEAHEGKGIMTEACRAIVTEGFIRFNFPRIEIRCSTENQKSSAIPRRLNFQEEGMIREAEWLHNRWIDIRVFSMLRQNWK